MSFVVLSEIRFLGLMWVVLVDLRYDLVVDELVVTVGFGVCLPAWGGGLAG